MHSITVPIYLKVKMGKMSKPNKATELGAVTVDVSCKVSPVWLAYGLIGVKFMFMALKQMIGRA